MKDHESLPTLDAEPSIFLQPCPVAHELFTILYSSSKKLKPCRHRNVCGFPALVMRNTVWFLRNTMFQHPKCSACIRIQGSQHAALADFRNVPRHTFLSILSSCKFMSCIDSGWQEKAGSCETHLSPSQNLQLQAMYGNVLHNWHQETSKTFRDVKLSTTM